MAAYYLQLLQCQQPRDQLTAGRSADPNLLSERLTTLGTAGGDWVPAHLLPDRQGLDGRGVLDILLLELMRACAVLLLRVQRRPEEHVVPGLRVLGHGAEDHRWRHRRSHVWAAGAAAQAPHLQGITAEAASLISRAARARVFRSLRRAAMTRCVDIAPRMGALRVHDRDGGPGGTGRG